ncbi:MAG TPA: DUF485 domain-containing protein [Candidatus Dormibacteraeota bacterium]|nr:DUF485 domain-containing protein [Candidatus Dormibacteraeota bacterium]
MEVGKSPPRQGAPPPDVASGEEVHWEGLEETDEFRQLVRARWRFVAPATVFFLVYYFALPLSNGLFPSVMRTEIIGHINLAYVFAVSEFVMAWVLAYFYIRLATRVFDPLAEKVRQRASRGR